MADSPTDRAAQEFVATFEEIGSNLVDFLPSLNALRPEDVIALLDPAIARGAAAVQVKLEEQFGSFIGRFITGVMAAGVLIITKSSEALGLAVGLIDAFRQEGQTQAFELKQPKPLDPDSLVLLLFRKIVSLDDYVNDMKRNGFTPNRAAKFALSRAPMPGTGEILTAARLGVASEAEIDRRFSEWGYGTADRALLLSINRTLLTPDEMTVLYQRGDLSQNEYLAKLRQYGLNGEDQSHQEKLSHIIPPLTDIIRMAGKEAFEEDQVRALSLGEELPQLFVSEAKKIGLDEVWAKRYWYAHWDLPSLNQAFEMLHRRVIKEEDVKAMFKAVEIAPVWRDRLLAISYNPLTRVDIRRMYDFGVINEEEVKNGYLDNGYSPENAERLTEFTVAGSLESAVGIVRARMFTLFRRGMITEVALRAFLVSLKWSEPRIAVVIENQKFLAQIEIMELEVRAVRDLFMKGVINESETLIALTALALPFQAIADFARLWVLQKKGRISRITLRDLKEALKEEIITEEEYRKELIERGFRKKDADILVRLRAATTTEETPVPTESDVFAPVPPETVAPPLPEEGGV